MFILQIKDTYLGVIHAIINFEINLKFDAYRIMTNLTSPDLLEFDLPAGS